MPSAVGAINDTRSKLFHILNEKPRPTPIVPAAIASAVGVLETTAASKAVTAAWDN